VPGRKTDIADSAWTCQLVEHGLVRPSFVPDKPIRELRDLTRYRKALIQECSRTPGSSSPASPRMCSECPDGPCSMPWWRGPTTWRFSPTSPPASSAPSCPALREALAGHFQSYHWVLISELLAHLDYLDEVVARLSQDVAQVIARFETKLTLLDTIPGVNRRTAEVILAEIGPDMARFASAAHLASWAGTCPGINESAGKHESGKTRKGSKWLRLVWSRRPRRPSAPRTATWHPRTPASKGGVGTRRPSSPWPTRSSSSPTTSCSETSPTRGPDRHPARTVPKGPAD
jgi:hypothetical protein